MITRIGVISDTHVKNMNDDYARTLKEIVPVYLAGTDLILHAGDIVDLSVLEWLSGIAETIAVSGNMDQNQVKDVLPDRRIIETAGFKIGLTHGHGPPSGLLERVRKGFSSPVDCIVFGHSHEPLNETIDEVLFFNPGSLTDQVFVKHNSLGILELGGQIRGKIISIYG